MNIYIYRKQNALSMRIGPCRHNVSCAPHRATISTSWHCSPVDKIKYLCSLSYAYTFNSDTLIMPTIGLPL